MKKTLYLYLLKEQCTPVLICLTGAVFVLVTGQLLQLMRILFASSCSIEDIAQLILFAMPRLILYAAPMASLLGVMLAFVRLNSDNELIAFRAAGTGFLGFLPPVLGVLVLITLLSFVNAVWLLPASNRAFEGKLRTLGRTSIPSLLEEGVFISAIPKLVLFFRSVDHTDYEIKGIFIQDQREPNQQVTIAAKTAKIDFPPDSSAIIFKLSNGIITRTARNVKDAQAVAFKNYEFTLPMDEILGAAKKVIKSRGEMSLVQIYRRAKAAVGKAALIWWSLELEQRLAFPAACLFLGLLGPPLGSMFRQRGRMTGITIGIVIFLAYYVLLSAGRTFGFNDLMSPFWAVWTPNLLCIALAVYLWTKLHRETPFCPASLGRLIARLRPSVSRGNKQGAVQ
ncbi:MAG: LptF/LptG family permease [Syntrophobacteraceae bacterium]|nr:LptF/LptG family permease [Syntrophobacteraceae bacterium]